MKHGSTLFLRLSVLAIGGAVLLLCTLLLPSLWQVASEYPDYTYAVYAVLATLYATTIPYYIGLFKAWQILAFIDTGQAFTNRAVAALRTIAKCAGLISVLYAVSLPFFYIWADNDDAPGLVVIGIVLTGVPMVAAVCMAVLSRLLHEAIMIKHENDLTV